MSECNVAVCADETSEDSVAKYRSPEKAVPRRKSSLFNRRNSAPFLGKESLSDSPSDDTGGQRQIEFEAYVESLKTEIDDWKTMYKMRRQIRKKAERKAQSKTVMDEASIDNVLTEEDKTFLANRPNYFGLAEDKIKALEELQVSIARTRDIEKSTLLLVKHAQLALSVMNKRIVEDSVVQ